MQGGNVIWYASCQGGHRRAAVKPTIAKKIGLLLLLFNLTGIFALTSVSLLIGRRSNEDELRSATARQHRLAMRLRSDLQSHAAEPDFISRIRRDVNVFDAALREVEQIVSEPPSYDLDAAARRPFEDLRTKWSPLQTSLRNPDFGTRFPQDGEYSKAIKAQAAEVAEVSRKSETAVRDAARRERNRTIVLALLGACVLNACLWLAGMWITKWSIVRPLQVLDEAVRSQEGGRLQQVPVTSGDELGNLARSFNDMSRRIETLLADNDRSAEQLRQAQKMEAIGQLSAGVAHDFNNILMVVSGHVALLLEEDLPPQALASVTEIQKAAGRASGLTRQLLAFSRKQSLQPKIVNPNHIVKNACAMIVRLIGENIQVRTCLSPDVMPLRVDPVEMERVLMNLAINARDAMPNGGILTIRTETVLPEDHPAFPERPFKSGPYVLVSVEDTGCGMDEATKSRVFEPFFTTKPVGRGTGLGLSTVYGIVKQSAGMITVDSQPGNGTTFRIYLPSIDAQVEQAAIPESPKSGSENILLVEDEDAVRDITAQGLERLGYHVISARDAVAAKQICAAHSNPIDVLLTDVIMPDTNGPRLARALKSARPEMRVLFMSGYTDDSLMECGFSMDSVDLINKPFTFDQLHRKLRHVLDKPRAPGMVVD